MSTTKLITLLKISLLIGLVAASVSACTTYVTPNNHGPYYAHPHQGWIPGHYNRFGAWIPGHWR